MRRALHRGRSAAIAPLSLALALVLVAGCGARSSYQIEGAIDRRALGTEVAEQHRALVAQGDALWRQRLDPAKLAAALDRWTRALRLKDDDWETYARLARGYFFQAEAFHAFEASGGDYPFSKGGVVNQRAAERARAAHQRGYQLALRGMAARSREFEQRLRAGIDLEDAIRVMRKDSASLVYWYVTNLARWARATGNRALFGNRHAILGSIRHLHRIDAAYFHGGGHRLLAIYYAAAPGIAGGDLDKARRHFEAALAAGPHFLANQVFAAEFLDRKASDRASFERRLRAVLAAPDGPPDLAPENAVARRMAAGLLHRLPRYFPD